MAFDFVGIGNAIVDILSNVDDEFILNNNLNKSHMMLCTKDQQESILNQIDEYWTLPGGSVANTIASLSKLSSKCGFAGLVSNDLWGEQFKLGLNAIDVDLLASADMGEEPTGTSVILITGDAERTMNTHLGISEYLNNANLQIEKIIDTKWLIVEGYLFDKEKSLDKLLEIIKLSKDSGVRIALSLSDKFCVTRNKDIFSNLFSEIHLLFSNESEFTEQFDLHNVDLEAYDFKDLINSLPETTVITRSAKKCICVNNGDIYYKESKTPTKLIDLTGAGDQFAAGFLYGVLSNWDIEKSLGFGVDLATQVISVIGPQLSKETLMSIRQYIR